MLQYPSFIHPVALEIGSFKVHWYGLMYLFAFLLAGFLAVYRAKKKPSNWHGERITDQIADLIFFLALGVIVGGRLGSVFFYEFSDFVKNPVMLLQRIYSSMNKQ